MRYILIAIVALVLPAQAFAWHAYITHFPTTTVMANGGGYTATGHVVFTPDKYIPINEAYPNQGRPCVVNGVHYCRFLNVVDLTGYGFSWHMNTLIPRLKMISEAAENRVVFRTMTGPKTPWTSSMSSQTESKKWGPPGKIVIYSSDQVGTSGRALGCFYYNPAPTSWPAKVDFCGSDEQHNFWTAVIINNYFYHPVTGLHKERTPAVLAHELGHSALHLGDTYYPHAPNGATDCGIAAGGDVSIMCANPFRDDFFSTHDRAAYSLRSGHQW